MLCGWVDFRSSPTGGSAYNRWCAFKVGSATDICGNAGIAPASNTPGVQNAIINIRNRISTFCASGSGATAPWTMPKASGYLSEMGTWMDVVFSWNPVGYHDCSLTILACDEIVFNGFPVIIGTGWL